MSADHELFRRAPKRNMSGCLLKGPFWSFLQQCSQESSSYKAEQWCSGSESRYRDAFHFPCIFQSNMRGQQWGWVTLPFHPLGRGRGWLMLALWRSWSLLDIRSMSTLPSGTGQCWSQVGFFWTMGLWHLLWNRSCRNLSKCQRCTWKPSQGFVEGGVYSGCSNIAPFAPWLK